MQCRQENPNPQKLCFRLKIHEKKEKDALEKNWAFRSGVDMLSQRHGIIKAETNHHYRVH